MAFTTRITPAANFFESQRTALLLQPFACNAAGAVEIEGEISAKEARGLQAAQQEVGVGNCGLHTAPVADGTGIGSGRFGAYAENASGVEAGE